MVDTKADCLKKPAFVSSSVSRMSFDYLLIASSKRSRMMAKIALANEGYINLLNSTKRTVGWLEVVEQDRRAVSRHRVEK